ncbi:MAG: group I intron-associated PD-(D/E)XK endonuclease, partial [Byssovorax sp.]
MEKKSHLGKAGQLAAMAEFLLRGYNVAIPEVDVGDDIFVVDDRIGDLSRIQVKTATTLRGASYRRASAQFKLSRHQLENARPVDLTYVFVLRRFGAWSFYVVPRQALNEMRAVFEASRVARGASR